MDKCKRCDFWMRQNEELIKVNAALGEWCRSLMKENEQLKQLQTSNGATEIERQPKT